MIPRRRLLLAVAVALIPLTASAHSVLVRSEPARGAALARAPQRVRLWFSERIEPAYAQLSVWSAPGVRVDAGDAAVDPGDPTLLSASTPGLGPGRYTVRYRVLSVDAHVVESSFEFSVKGVAR